MKICHMSSLHSPDIRIFYRECKTLAESGYEVHLIAKYHENEIKDDVYIHALPIDNKPRKYERLKNIYRVYKIAGKINADVYHFHDPELIPIGLIFKLLGKKVIFDSHEDTTSAIRSKRWINKQLRPIISFCYYLFEQFAVIFFNAVISGHPKATQNIKKSIPVYNYPDLKMFSNYFSGGQTNSKFLWFGLLSEGRGASVIREAVRSHPELIVDVIGRVYDISWREDRVNFLGNFPVDEAYKMLSGYTAGLVTYLPEPNNINSSPNKMFEYMALGLPVIASNFSEWKQIIENNHCGICIDPQNSDELSRAMKYILNNKDIAKKMGKNGKKIVSERYNWTVEKEKLLNIYRRLDKNSYSSFFKQRHGL